jgi:hypothetical protein
MTVSKTVALTGHLIDSLILTKVIDIIQAQGGSYRTNVLHVGNRKQDFSHVNLTISAPNAQVMDDILDLIAPHGAKLAASESATLAPVTSAGRAPEDAYPVGRLPKVICLNDQSLTVENAEADLLVLVVDPANGQVAVCRQADLQPGQQVVIGAQGLDW